MEFKDVVDAIGKGMDGAGVAVIVVGLLVTSAGYARALRADIDRTEAYRSYRQGVGKAILLGLEILVAADIIRTVAVSPTFRSAGILAIIVAIRTFLSVSLQVELEGRLPWRPAAGASQR